MQKLARSTFSATAKDALLDEFKAIVDAGEVTLRSDSSTIAQLERTYHLDSSEITRYTRAIEALNDRYGWHLDAQKTLSRLGKKLGKKCGGGWISPEKKCKSHYTDGKLNSSGKTSSADLADRIRSRKKMAVIRSRDGKMKNGQWDIGAAFAPGNEQQSSIRASRTGPNNNRTLNPDRAARMMAKEENRARVNWGKTTGDWKQEPDSVAAMDMVGSAGTIKKTAESQTTTQEKQPNAANADRKSIPQSHRKAGDGTREIADRLRSEQDIQKFATGKIIETTGKIWQNQENLIKEVSDMVNEDLGSISPRRASSRVETTPDRKTPNPKTSKPTGERLRGGDKVRAIAANLREESKVQKGATFGVLKVAEKIYDNQNKLIKEVSDMVNEDLDRKPIPMKVPGMSSRSSSEPRKRGRSVD